ncbi:MAG: LytTR family transcriptional regulator DNA-binding domain-containing protein [Acidimicrobiaceae bacterium]|nr:LytTR family transcriptional regulator DNA-binding domain-containing protein [Acidimicrobiaceae bacterium]
MNGSVLANGSLNRTAAAWERFVDGADSVQGVRPEILMSWYRCREEYGVNPRLEQAPVAAEASPHSIEHDVVFAELGGVAASAADEVGSGCLVTVTDPDGRVLVSYGSPRVLGLAEDSNLAPWSTWSEWASGTNGMGTALKSHGPVIVAGPEHWCRAFHSWICAGIAIRNVVTDEPLATLGISCWKSWLPGTALSWLRKAVATTEATLRRRADHAGSLLAAAFADSRLAPSTPLAAVDLAGNVVLANTEAAVLLGTPADTPAYAPADRWTPRIPALTQLVGQAMGCARHDPHWTGATQLFVPFLGAPVPVAVHPVPLGTQLIGALLAFGSPDGELDGNLGSEIGSSDATLGSIDPNPVSRRVVALRQDRWVLLEPAEIRYAEVDGNNVWLMSDQGRLQAATRGLDRLEHQLQDQGFLRVHRRFLVNLNRIREIEQGFKGSLFLHTDTRTHESIPVARRHMPDVRRALGLQAHG